MVMIMKRNLRGVWRCCYELHTFASDAQHYCDKPPFNLLFLGTDSFALETLKALQFNRLTMDNKRVVNALHVVTTSKKTPVADFARLHGLPLLSWPPPLNDLDLYDLGVLVSFGRMVPRKVIASFPLGILNVHPSLLPRWRGSSPIIHTVLNADTETGVSIISIQPSHFDRGPVVQQERTAVPQQMSAQSLADLLAVQGSSLLLRTLQAMPDILNTATSQADTGVTYAHKMTSCVTWVNWEEHTTCQVQQQYLALSHMLSLRTLWNSQTIKLMNMVLDTEDSFTPSTLHPSSPLHRGGGGKNGRAVKAGTVTFDPHQQAVCVRCADGWVAFRSIVLGKPMSAADFHNGYLSKDKYPDLCFQSVANGLFDAGYWDFVQHPKVRKS